MSQPTAEPRSGYQLGQMCDEPRATGVVEEVNRSDLARVKREHSVPAARAEGEGALRRIGRRGRSSGSPEHSGSGACTLMTSGG
jgi:hypothetical protein